METEMDESADAQIDRLAKHITENVPGEPSQSQGAVDTAIRLLSSAQDGIALAKAVLANLRPGKDLGEAGEGQLRSLSTNLLMHAGVKIDDANAR